MPIAKIMMSAGLMLDLVGVLVVASGVYRRKQTILNDFVPGNDQPYGGYQTPEDDPEVSKEIKETRALMFGISIILIGFALQLVGTWL